MSKNFFDVQINGRFGYYATHEMMVKDQSWAGSADAIIEAHLRFEGSNVASAGRVYVFIFPESQDYLVQMLYDFLQVRDGCPDFRDPEILQLNSANVNTSLLLGYESWFYSKPKSEAANRLFEIGQFDFKVAIPYSTRWAVYLTHCAPNTGGKVTVNGNISFVNSFGHLDADQYPMLVSYSAVALPVVGLILVAYVAFMARYRRNLHKIQLLLPACLVLAALACVVITGSLYVQNRTGIPSTKSVLFLVSFFYALFFGVSRFVLLLVTHGVGIVYYNTGTAKISAMMGICAGYTLLVMIQKYFELLKDPFQQIGPFVISVLLPAYNLIYFVWANHTLSQSTVIASTSRNSFKVNLFDNLTMLFYVNSILLGLIGLIHFVKLDVSSKLWPVAWLFEFYAFLVYIGSIVAAMVLFRPRRLNRYYHYSEDAEQQEQEVAKKKSRVSVNSLETDLPHRRAGSHLPLPLNQTEPSSVDETLDPNIPPRKSRRTNPKSEDLRTTAQRTMLLSSPVSD
jgi:hypothetical protein